MIPRWVAVAALGVVAGCASSIPDSNPNAGGGVGFGTPDQFAAQRAARDRELETASALIEAIGLYQKMGFVEKDFENKTPRCDKSF